LDRVLRFRIEALLRVEPTPEPVTFDSVLEPVTGNFELKGRDRD
jgi:type VI secretion system protein ImpF